VRAHQGTGAQSLDRLPAELAAVAPACDRKAKTSAPAAHVESPRGSPRRDGKARVVLILAQARRGYRSTAVRSKDDLDIKEIVNLWAGGSAAVKSNAGQALK
jgi:hypothetical protein